MPSQNLARIDWRKLSAIEVNTFESELQSNRWSVSEIGSMIAYSYIDSEFDLNSVDSNFIKVFKLSQIVIAYLLEKYFNHYEQLKEQVDQANYIVQENRKLRKLLEVYKQAFTFGGSISRSIGTDISEENHDKLFNQFQCPDCPKAFGNSVYLQSHIYRRHPENSIISRGLMPLTQRINQYHSALLPSATVDDVKKELENLKDQLKKTEDQLVEEKESRMALQVHLDTELEAKIKQLTSLLELNKNGDNSNLISQPSNIQQTDGGSKLSLEDENTDNRDETDGDQISPSKPLNVEETQNLTGLLLAHTQEVRNLGSNLQKLVDKLWSNDSLAGLKSSNDIGQLENDKKIETKVNAQSTSEKTESENDREFSSQGIQVLSYLDRYMEALGIMDKSCIRSNEFAEAMKVIKERRKRIGFQDKVDSLKDALEYEIRTRKIGQTLAQLNDESTSSTMHDKSLNASQKDSVKSPWLIAKSSLEETSAKQQEKQNRVRFGGITIQELDKAQPQEFKAEKVPKKLWTKPKSVLIRRDAQGNRIGNVDNKPKRRISFSEKRIEISPEYSSDDDDFDQMMAGEIQTATIEVTEDDKLESINDSAMDISLNKAQSCPKPLYLQPSPELLSDPAPPTPKPRASKSFGLNDHLSTADLKWFDSDGSDEIEEDNLERKKSQKVNNTKNIENSNKTLSMALDDDDQRVSVTELTKIIEEQLHNRQNRQANSKTNLTNSVDAVTGKSNNTNSGYGVKAIGTLNYDSDSD
ncbi:zinc finger protein Dzip1-like [Tetranychus urticae]|uniref:C2H2-type domain-containing protein n=1 Tax=Tetranychus urticae TaxID=32264 RepID=T1L0G1_TETUR|nr:zinc finger protein Dzip1-like [Tetranychus urticae]